MMKLSTMQALSDELREIHETAFDEVTAVLNEHGIENLYDYLKYLGRGEFSLPEEKFLKNTLLRTTTRVYPGGDQNVMFISLNPKIKEWAESHEDSDGPIPSDTLKWLSQYAVNIDTYAAECALEYQYNYLDTSMEADTKGFHHLLPVLNDFNLISFPEAGVDEYLENEYPSPVFSDIYFTNWYKLGTQNQGETNKLPAELDRISYNCFVDEIQAVDPDIIFAFGEEIQDELKPHINKPLSYDAPAYDSVSGIAKRFGYLYELDISNKTPVMTLNHQTLQGWNQAIEDTDLPQVRESFREHIKK